MGAGCEDQEAWLGRWGESRNMSQSRVILGWGPQPGKGGQLSGELCEKPFQLRPALGESPRLGSGPYTSQSTWGPMGLRSPWSSGRGR